MERFEGTVRLAGDTVALQAVLLVADQRLKISTEQHEIGDWKLTEVTSSLLPDGCHLRVEGEELIVGLVEPVRFAEAIGPRWTNPGNGSLRNAGSPADETVEQTGARRRLIHLARAIPRAAHLMAAGVAGSAALALWAPLVLITIVLLLGLAALLVGSIAAMDPFLAVRLPDPRTPVLLIRGGAIGVGVALLLAVAL
ncbi:MAG: hypothetical protein HKN80_14390 [Acidimicrobiia bacterium]|nr:hypothetical protein [Acidimicrobiia bacterium]